MATYKLIGGPFEGEWYTIPDDRNVVTLPVRQMPRIVPSGGWPISSTFDYADYSLRRFNFNDSRGKPVRQLSFLVYTKMSDDEACRFLDKYA